MKKRIFIYTLLILFLFATAILFVEQNREKAFKIEGLESTLDGYTEIIHRYIGHNLTDTLEKKMPLIMDLLPGNIRVSIIKNDGTVIFDNYKDDLEDIENHRERPELKKALMKNHGSHIRLSQTTNEKFIYYAKFYNQYFVRVAQLYDIQIEAFLQSDNMFLYIFLVLFLIVILALRHLLNRYSKTVSQLKDFVVSVQKQDLPSHQIPFPDDDLGQIARSVVVTYQQLEESRKTINLEREKLLQHFHYSLEGLCFFTADRKKVYANTHFIQLMNVILDYPTFSPEKIFDEPTFKEIKDYLDNNEREKPLFNSNISQNGKILNVRLFIFDDGSFEITLNDVTKSEKNRLIKQEMTNSIAHELRTPVTSVRGFLETILNNKLDEEKNRSFIEKAYLQIVRLSELIQDIGIITKIEEAPDRFQVEKITIKNLLDELVSDTTHILMQNKIVLNVDVSNDIEIVGNRTLLYAIFRNLIDNSIRHGGENITISIRNYTEDAYYYYFSYSDTGKGIEEKHLPRIFERFYRANEGRSRDSSGGGSGLGLSIVKNAIQFHKGEITAKNSTNGGLEFLFTMQKK